jgi:hypothetical protein
MVAHWVKYVPRYNMSDNQRDATGNVLALRALPWLLLGCIQHTPDMFWHRVKTGKVWFHWSYYVTLKQAT